LLNKFLKCIGKSYLKRNKVAETMNKNNASLIILAFVVSSVTLWLLESPLKPMLYFFEAALILTIYYSLYGNFKKTMFKIKEKAVTKLYSNLSTTGHIVSTIVAI